MTEQELAAAVKDWLLAERWEVFSEVRRWGDHGPRADLVARNGNLLWVVEVKLSLSLAVMAQAADWAPFAHHTSVAVRAGKFTAPSRLGQSKARAFAMRVLEDRGIGLLEAIEGDSYPDRALKIHQRTKPSLNRRAVVHHWQGQLHGGHQHDGAGSQSRFWSPYRQTCLNLARIVGQEPGIQMAEAFRRLKDHHYASGSTMRSSLSQWLAQGKVRGVRRALDGRAVRLYPEAK